MTRVEFRAGDGPVVVDESAPYEAVLDVAPQPDGDLVLTVTAVGVAPETATATRTIVRRPHASRASGSDQGPRRGDRRLGARPRAAGRRRGGSRVDVVNPSRGAANQRPSFADGSFAMRIAAGVGETLA